MVVKLLAPVFIFTATAFGQAEIITGQVLVQFRAPYRYQIAIDNSRTGLAPVDDLDNRFGVYKIEKVITDPRIRHEQEDFGLDRLYLLYFPKTRNSMELIAAYKNLPEVEEAWPNMAYPVLDKPNDPRLGWHIDKCHLPDAWNVSHGDTSIVICDIDNGVDWVHEDIQSNLWINSKEDINHNGRFDTISAGAGGDLNGIDDDGNGKIDDVIGWNFKHSTHDPEPDIIDPFYCSHGTSTFGVAAGATNNGIGIAGTGWKCRGMAVNCDLDNAHINGTLAIQGIQYAAANGARVINMSFGGGPDEYASVLKYAKQKGCLCFAAAGNDNTSTPSYPAADANALAVAALSPTDHKSSYSDYGTWIALCAPGDQIPAPEVDNYYSNVDGTSFASPIVAGIAALVWSAHPTWKASQVAQAILSTCDSLPDPLYYQNELGKGRVNAYRAIIAKAGAPESTPVVSLAGDILSAPSPFSRSTTISYEVSSSARISLKVYDRAGSVVETLIDGFKPAGRYTISWSGQDSNCRPVPAGIYFFRFESNGKNYLTKSVLLK